MPRANHRPLDERARARLRDAQKIESDAVAFVHAPSATRFLLGRRRPQWRR